MPRAKKTTRPKKAQSSTVRPAAPEMARGASVLSAAPEWTGWEKFARVHAKHPALKEEAIYAIPQVLLDVLIEQEVIDFSGAEKRFERALAKVPGIGLFCGRPIACPFLMPESGRISEDAQNDIDRALTDLYSKAQSDRYLKGEQDRRKKVDLRRRAYVGWLVMQAEFVADCMLLQKRWGDEIRLRGCFPRVARKFFGEPIGSTVEFPQELMLAFQWLYTKWGLETLASWDVPVPLKPHLNTGNYPFDEIQGAGISLLLPWYLLKDEAFPLKAIASHAKTLGNPKHLEKWLNSDRKFGWERSAAMMRLVVAYEFAVKRRYESPHQRFKKENLDRALSKLLYGKCKHTDESAKKLRQKTTQLREKALTEADHLVRQHELQLGRQPNRSRKSNAALDAIWLGGHRSDQPSP